MVLHPERRPFYLITSRRRRSASSPSSGIDALILIPFSLDYARTTAEAFVREILWERLRIRKILIGHDYTFGRGKEGNEAFSRRSRPPPGIRGRGDEPLCIGDTVISSTKIRNALLAGEVGFAATLLGRPYNLSGLVVSGNRRGRPRLPDGEHRTGQGARSRPRRLCRPLPAGRKAPRRRPQHRLQPDLRRRQALHRAPHLPFSREYLRGVFWTFTSSSGSATRSASRARNF